jgi:2-keto-4-pentenoate hydratase
MKNAADTLAQHRFEQTRHPGLSAGLAPATLADGYAIQHGLVSRLLAHNGGQVVGYKIAATSDLVQRALNVPGPMYGRLLSYSTVQAGDSPVRLNAADYVTRTIEPEFGFRMVSDVPAGTHDATSIAAWVDTAHASIELVDHRFLDWSVVGAAQIIADNAIHGAWVYGPACAGWRDLDLATHPVSMFVNGTLKDSGVGGAALGHPLNALAWLANTLAEQGSQLKAGDFVTTGIVTNVYQAVAGDAVTVDFGVLGRVSVQF